MKRIVFASWVLVLLAALAACSTTTETKQDDRVYKAYGDSWTYSKTEFDTEYMAIDSPHGFLGPRRRSEERHVIRNSAGQAISIPDNLYAVQRDGTLKKIDCCRYASEKGDLYNFGDELVFIFDNARQSITDCFIHPSGQPGNELRPPGQRIHGVTVYAVFDPEAHVFIARTFQAGEYQAYEYKAALLRTGRRDFTTSQRHAFSYAKRKPFMCGLSGPVPGMEDRSGDAYAYYPTRTVRVSVAPEATGEFVQRLRDIAARRSWAMRSAGEGKDLSFALEGGEIQTIATGDAAGLWRVAFYERHPKSPAGLTSPRGVDALVREIGSELERPPGVTLLDAGG